MTTIAFFFAIIPTSLCVGVAAYMAINGMSGWGWFLFSALVLGAIAQGVKP